MSARGGEEGTAEGSRQTPPMHAIRSNVLYTHMYSAHDTACAWIDGHVTTRMELAAYICTVASSTTWSSTCGDHRSIRPPECPVLMPMMGAQSECK